MTMAKTLFLSRLQRILDRFAATQSEALDTAQSMASVIARGGLVHLYGSGHSVIPVMDAYPRYGSFVGLNPLTDPRLMWSNVLGPGCVRELISRTAAALLEQGISLPTFVSPTVPGASVESNDEVFAAHRARLADTARRETVVPTS
jgi:uncharacterized phosphosugar-binding protein